MRTIENKLSIWGGVCVFCAGLFFTIPGINGLAIVAAIIFLTLVVARLGFTRAILIALPGTAAILIVSSLTIGYQAGIDLSALFLLMVAAPSLMMGWGVRKFADPTTIVGYGLIPFAVILVLLLGIYAQLMGELPMMTEQVNSQLQVMIDESPALESLIEKSFPPAEGAVDRFIEANERIMIGTLRIFPAIMILGFLAAVLAAFVMAGMIALKWGIIFPRFKPFYLWRAGGMWLMITIVGLIPAIFSSGDTWFYAGVNILIVTGHVYFVVGLSIMESFFRRMYKPTPARIIFYGTFLFLGVFGLANTFLTYTGLIMLVFLIALGLSDSRFNFRKEHLEINE
ncbi:MAG: DUF2232 domain-containing protein [candidate division Zixibacteria bacterium]